MSKTTKSVPADSENGRPEDVYISISINDGYNHLAYYSPVDNATPVWLKSGEWEVAGSTALDLTNGLVYFVGTNEAPTQRHIYSFKFDGSHFRAVTDTSQPAYYYSISFSSGAGYAIENKDLKRMVKKHALPLLVCSNVTIDGHTLQVVERRPATFNPKKKYPDLFYLYGGPGSQTVDCRFKVDFQSYVDSSLEYIVVVTVDGAMRWWLQQRIPSSFV